MGTCLAVFCFKEEKVKLNKIVDGLACQLQERTEVVLQWWRSCSWESSPSCKTITGVKTCLSLEGCVCPLLMVWWFCFPVTLRSGSQCNVVFVFHFSCPTAVYKGIHSKQHSFGSCGVRGGGGSWKGTDIWLIKMKWAEMPYFINCAWEHFRKHLSSLHN